MMPPASSGICVAPTSQHLLRPDVAVFNRLAGQSSARIIIAVGISPAAPKAHWYRGCLERLACGGGLREGIPVRRDPALLFPYQHDQQSKWYQAQ